MATPSNFTLQEATAVVFQGKQSRDVHTCAMPNCSKTFSKRSNMIRHYCNDHVNLAARPFTNDKVIAHLQTQPNRNRATTSAPIAAVAVRKHRSSKKVHPSVHAAGATGLPPTTTTTVASVTGSEFRVGIVALQERKNQATHAGAILAFLLSLDVDVLMITEVMPGLLSYLKTNAIGYVVSPDNATDNPTRGHRHNVVLTRRSYITRAIGSTGGFTSGEHILKLAGPNKSDTYYAASINLTTSNETFISFHTPGDNSGKGVSQNRYDQIKTAITDTDAKYKSSSRFMMVMDANMNDVTIKNVNRLIADFNAQGLSVVQAGAQGRRKTCNGEYAFVFRGYEQVKNEELDIPSGLTNHKKAAVHTFKHLM